MKKRYIVVTTLIALIISLGLFTASVIAAVRVNFGINNTITFVGQNQNMAFEVNATIKGTRLQAGEQDPSHHWEYDYNSATSSTLEVWEVGNIEFDDTDKDNIKIIYEFAITNTGKAGDYKIKAYIVPTDIATEDLQDPIIIGTEVAPIEIDVNKTATLSLEISPESNMGFKGSRTCNFEVVVAPV